MTSDHINKLGYLAKIPQRFTASGRDLYRSEARFGLNELFILAQTSAYDLYSRKQEGSSMWAGFLDYLQRFGTISSANMSYFVPPTRA